MEGFIGSSLSRGVRSCWARRWSCNGYQRLRAAPTTTPGRGTRLGRRTVLGSAAWSTLGRLRRRRQRASAPRWSSPLQLLNRILDTYISSMLSQPLSTLKTGVSSSAAVPAPATAVRSPPSSPPKLRRDASPGSSSSRRRDAAGRRGVMLNICVAEVLLRRSTSEVRRSPLQQHQQTKDARRSSVRRA